MLILRDLIVNCIEMTLLYLGDEFVKVELERKTILVFKKKKDLYEYRDRLCL